MAMTCPGCGRYGRLSAVGRARRCVHCGHSYEVASTAMLIVTGAAATGKSMVCADLAHEAGLLALDVDVLAGGADAVSGRRRDYPEFWRYLFSIGDEVLENGLIPVFCGVCLPGQALAALSPDATGELHLLALVADDDAVEHRIRSRVGARPGIDTGRHREINAYLRAASVEPPHTLVRLDVTSLSAVGRASAAREWAHPHVVPNTSPRR